jgi:hypothetical protein
MLQQNWRIGVSEKGGSAAAAHNESRLPEQTVECEVQTAHKNEQQLRNLQCYGTETVPIHRMKAFLAFNESDGLCNGEVMCFLWGTKWTFIYYLKEIQSLKG